MPALLPRIFVTDFVANTGATPPGLAHLALTRSDASEKLTLAHNCSVFLAQWRGSVHGFGQYNAISRFLAKELHIAEHLNALPMERLLDVMTFEEVDRRIIGLIRDAIVSAQGNGIDALLEAIQRRLDGHWTKARLGGDAVAPLYRATYAALREALELFRLRRQYDAGFSFPTAKAMFKAYSQELIRFDQCYRAFL